MNFRIPDFPLGALLACILCITGLLFISPETPTIWLWETLIFTGLIIWALGAGFLDNPRHARKLGKPEDQEIKAESKKDPSNKNLQQSPVATDFSALIEAIKAEGRANRREERKEDRGSQLREQITIVLLGVTMGAIILQVHEMTKAYEPIHQQAKASVDQATAAIKQADAAVIQAQGVKDQSEAAKNSAIAARENMIASGRAWVGPSGAVINGTIALNQNSSVTVSYQNSGREPATDFIDTAEVFTVVIKDPKLLSLGNQRVGDNLAKCKILQPEEGAQVVFPSSGFAGNQLGITISKELSDSDLVSGDKILVATGCFAYKTFGTAHHSAFCFTYNKNVTILPNLNFCPGGSYAD